MRMENSKIELQEGLLKKELRNLSLLLLEILEDLMKCSMQGESRGQLPKNLSEFSDAISQTKKKIYSEYDALAKSAGEGGAFVSTE